MTISSIRKYSNSVRNVLAGYKDMGAVIPARFLKTSPYIFDFSRKNKKLAALDLNNAEEFIGYITATLKNNRCIFGVGGYGENRIIYRRSNLFESDADPRSIHLGVDLWMPAKTPVYSPLPAVLHSFRDNNNFGDYGPTIILRHSLRGITFFTLYGHLSRFSLKNLKEGVKIKKGQRIAALGNYNENGQWPSHLHFQLISNLLGKKGDFPGVASVSEKKYYVTLCPDPDVILRVNKV